MHRLAIIWKQYARKSYAKMHKIFTFSRPHAFHIMVMGSMSMTTSLRSCMSSCRRNS